MCAASTRVQARYRFTGNYNGYCDGTTTTPAFSGAGAGSIRAVYWNYKFNFVGAAFPLRKRQSGPISFSSTLFEPPAEDAKTIVLDMPLGKMLFTETRRAFLIYYDVELVAPSYGTIYSLFSALPSAETTFVVQCSEGCPQLATNDHHPHLYSRGFAPPSCATSPDQVSC
jgi:hypothetical protein